MDQSAGIWSHCLELAALSDIGLRRANNQDSYTVALAGDQADFQQRGHLFLVADGMGAHAAGELASKIAADVVSLCYRKLLDQSPAEAIVSALLDANHQIYTRGQASPEFRGMGTTACTLLLLPAGVLVAHVGDSRAYRLRGSRIEQLTFDHSLVWEMRASGQFPTGELPSYITRNIITRSLGPNPTVQVDLEGPDPVQAGDTFLLCSDGLSGQVRDDEIGMILELPAACRGGPGAGRLGLPARRARQHHGDRRPRLGSANGPSLRRRSVGFDRCPKCSPGASAVMDVVGGDVAGNRGPVGSRPALDGVGHFSWRRRRRAWPPGGNATARRVNRRPTTVASATVPM